MTYDDAYFDKAKAVIMAVLDAARPELMEAFGKIDFEYKGDKTVVTELDKSLEEKLKTALHDFDPEVGILGEESGQEGNDKTYWLVDPIDGTEAFIRGVPVSRNQMAFVHEGVALYALAYQFPTKVLFEARLGKGTTKNGERIVMRPRSLERSWIDVGMNMLDPENYEAFKRIRPQISGVVVLHNYLAVVEGQIDGIISSHGLGGPWDYVVMALLLSEAGMRVATIGSDSFDPDSKKVFATYPENFEALQKLLSPEA